MDIDLQLFKNVMAESRHNKDLLDSFSPNQFKSKERLINHIRDLSIVGTNSEMSILRRLVWQYINTCFQRSKKNYT